MNFTAVYDQRLVALSIVLAVFASYVALDLTGRTASAHPRVRAFWLASGSFVMGIGIWSMHFIGMLAFGLQVGLTRLMIGYDVVELLGSVFVAVGASALALSVASRRRLTRPGLVAAGLLLGVAIAGMHFLGMAAMRMAPRLSYAPGMVAASLVIAVVASVAALALARRFGETRSAGEAWAKRGAAAIMGIAIAGMHYTGMAAARFQAPMTVTAAPVRDLVATSGLVLVLAIGALVLLAVGLLGAALDRQHERHLAARLKAEDARYLSLTQSATEAIVSANAQGNIVFWNAAAERIFGYTSDDALGRPLSVLISENPDEVDGVLAAPYAPDDPVQTRTIELRGRRHDGAGFPMELALGDWHDGAERFVTAVIRDVTERRQAEDALRSSEQRFRTLVEHSPEAIVLHADGVILYANPAFASLIGAYDAQSLRGQTIANIVHPDSRPLLAQRAAVDVELLRVPASYRLLHRAGKTIDVEATTAPSVFNGRPARQTHLRDVTAQRELEAELAHQAFHDALTGLSNRSLFRNRVEHALDRAKRAGSPPAVLFLDLDNFKSVNDGLGHSAGDELLGTIARRLRFATRSADTCARLGGDEFAVLIEEPRPGLEVSANAAHLAERLLTALAAPCRAGGSDVVVSASIGIAVAGRDSTVDDLLRNADVAMYRAKASGKGRYEVFEPVMHEVVRRRLSLETDLRRAVETRDDPTACQFTLQYQPIVSLASGRIEGFEALARWQHPRLGRVPPVEFIPIAEETGLIVVLGKWILTQACAQTRRWQQEGIGGDDATRVGISVNLSARQVTQPDFARDVSTVLAETGLPPNTLLLEMTESLLLDTSETTLARFGALNELGVRVAIDDFGTGYSSLGYLERFSVDFLKIDRSFIERLGARDGESPVPRAIIGLGHDLRMHVVAEGIETAEQWARLSELGCDYGQGYYAGRPVDASAIQSLEIPHLAGKNRPA